MTTATVSRETPAVPAPRMVVALPLERIKLGPNVRVDVQGLDELAESIRAHGIIQPIKVRAAGDDWIVVWGQRRYLAAQMAELERIPCITTSDELSPADLAIEQLIENLHRADLPALDMARAFQAVVDAGRSQADLARELGLHPSTISNAIRLLGLDERVQEKVETGEISPTHARAIASLPAKQQRELAERVSRDKLSTHDLEREVKWKQDAAEQDERKAAKTAKWIPKAIAALEAEKIGKAITVYVSGDYYSMDPEAIRAGIAKAGWKVTTDYPRTPRPESCDCGTVLLSVGGRKAEIQAACSDRRHVDREANLKHLAEKREDDLWHAQNARLVEAVIPAIRAIPVPILRILHYRLERASGRYGDWEAIARLEPEQLVGMFVDHFTTPWGMQKVDQAAVLRELGIEPAATTEEGEAA
jgi:ParB family transcriptional regulator, chromosome partitioning protein